MDIALLLPLMIIVLIVLMFLQSSKQRKAMKALRQMQDSLTVGDKVLTTSGMHATVVSIGEETLGLEIAPGVRTQWDRRVIRERIEGGTATDAKPDTDGFGSRTGSSDQ